MTAGIWIPGDLIATNRALSDQRAAGFFAGYREAMVRTGKWCHDGRPAWRGGIDRYAQAAADVRGRVVLAARGAHLAALPAGARVRLRFSVQGHPRWDASGGMLAAKWAEDGLVEAGVIPSDRFNVDEVAIHVVQDPAIVGAPSGVYVAWELR